eukprot:6874099-Prymnesium_polylepis.1
MAMEEAINADADAMATEAIVAAAVDADVAVAAPEAEPRQEPTKRKVFKRERELKGVLRTYKVRMLPTPEQRQELKLAFSMARKAYNWAVAAVNGNTVPCNFQQLRNAFEKEPLPRWAKGSDGNRL